MDAETDFGSFMLKRFAKSFVSFGPEIYIVILGALFLLIVT